MTAKRNPRIALVVLVVACLVPSLSAVIVEIRDYHGKKFSCVHGGLVGVAKECGTEGYARVFTGTVKSATDVGETDKRLQIVPDEIFLGDSANEVTAIANQACLGSEIQAGDKWLFYLRRDPTTGTLVLPYDSPSKPVIVADDDLSMLRDLGRLADSGILIGNVERLGETYDVKPIPLENHKVVANSLANGTNYTTYTNANGHFEFELPAGSYEVSASTEHGFREVEGFRFMWGGRIPVAEHRCFEKDISLIADGKLAGHVSGADGKPATFVKVALIPISPVRAQFTVVTDKNGYFETRGRQPGQYIVGIGLLEPFASAEWKSRVYYPGVPTREQARIVELEDGEWRSDIDFKLLPSADAN
jgi:Carboxypeptidase regulatory-like domain